ncbi:Basic leucine zipper 23 [Cardamine amara subsp. amara]|uniref:Basic leucine zipper 23 n=1 Tax=Cardamine amara subsp. amara TaxID=228776 RepID=A0ABD1B403_CARAN
MDDGELEFSNQMGVDLPLSNCSMDSFFDELLRDSCTHTHTCNPPGPENTHTHTCLHVHTKILPAQSEDNKVSNDDDTSESSEKKSKKRPLGNREAVRKYREKKKAKAASLEDEVIRLRAVNNQLLKRLQGQAALEAEVTRLKCLLVDIRGRIDGEIGSFPYQKPAVANAPFSYMMHPCNMQCDDDNLYCLQNGNNGEGVSMNEQGLNGCEFDQLQCLANQNLAGKEIPVCSNGIGSFSVNASGANKRKGEPREAEAV